MPTDTQELKREMLQKGVESLLDAHKVPARHLLAALQKIDSLVEEHSIDTKDWRDTHDEFRDLIDQVRSMVEKHQDHMDSWASEAQRLTSIDHLKGEPGESTDPNEVIQALIPHLPKPESIDRKQIVADVLGLIPAPEKEEQPELDTETLFQEFVARIQKERLIDVSHIKNSESFIFNKKKYKIEELMHGSGGSGSSSGTSIYNEVVSGSGTAWTLAHTPNTGTLRLYANGQRLTLTVDYTIAGANITTLSNWSAGTLLADYIYT